MPYFYGILTRLELHILRSRPVTALIGWLRKISLPGFEGVSLFDSLNFFRKQIFSNRFYSKASAISFSFLMALPPLLLFFFSLIPYLPLPEQKIIDMLNDMLVLLAPTPEMQQKVNLVIRDFITHKKNVLLSFSVLLTIYYSSNGMMGLLNTFETRLPGFRRRHWLKQRGVAILLTFFLVVVFIFTLLVMLFQSWLFTWLGFAFLKKNIVLKLIAYLVIFFMCLLTISFTFKYGTATVNKLKVFSPGAITSTVLISIITIVFFWAVNNLVHYDKIYGSIGTLIFFMVWINLVAQVLLIGFELNASIIVNRKSKSGKSLKTETTRDYEV
ncbi:MAG: YihY/virulence factor BrkB family protein [Chitinophagaceae bacterium]|nr:YihY/virulence factor BrkB family protein [Chitinophagaceae bacterium]